MTERRRRRRWWRDLALILFNTAVLFLLVELALVVLSTLGSSTLGVGQGSFDDLRRHYLGLSVYRDRPWAEGYWNEVRSVVDMPYQPFLTWRTRPHRSDPLWVDAAGIRRTPGARCATPPGQETESLEIWVFGGSTVWGWGAPDAGTLPAQLQWRLEERLARPVCVVNLGENGYVASQNLLRLEERLRQGHRPDRVIFYDGVNDVMGAYHDGRVGAHQNLALYRQRWAEHESPLRTALARLEISHWLVHLSPRRPPERDADALAAQITRHHLGLLDTLGALGRGFGFRHHGFWQPHITTGAKPASAEEAEMAEKLAWTVALEPPLVALFRQTARRMEEAAQRRPDLDTVVDVFDTRSETVWIDTWGHMGPEGNDRVAERLLEILGPTFDTANSTEVSAR